MKIIISPAKKMNIDTDTFAYQDLPVFVDDAEMLMQWIREKSYEELKKLWACNDKITEQNFERFRDMNLRKFLTPALISYEGIQYQYMAPEVFTQDAWDYVQEHLRILSGFYGVVKPLDGVTPYRLEMQAKAAVNGTKNLYDFWNHRLYDEVMDESRTILNLASKEYSKCIEKYLKPEDIFVTCIFGEWKDGKIIQKGTQAKMARGEMVRFMAENGIEGLEQIKTFDRLGYQFSEENSRENIFTFIK